MKEKAIFVTGMARTGTTIMTHTLTSHPDISTYIGGREAYLLENDYMSSSGGIEYPKEIKKIIKRANDKNKFALFKRPWVHKYPEEFKKYFPNSYFILMTRSCQETLDSWKRFGGGHEKLNKDVYEKHLDYYDEFIHILGEDRCLLISLEDMISNKEKVFKGIAKMIGIDFKFNLTAIGENRHWNLNTFAIIYGNALREIQK